ncbi:DUF6036 family nucleotidyltransferase [Agrococcus sp. KRD186]|uniref:DUF6036 family nucleotidyltransferase n=1 Tax=Agrococcus sp. KRD186 TaxID=2729730 RepID=UPI0019D17C36|nr:DUF6036 family nucleotidyltransferase [Agrococcus sp. KRD186]
MKRDELAELLRRAASLTEDGDILVVGSQAILGSFAEEKLPDRAVLSREVDLVFLRDPDRRKADLVNAIIGEMSPHDAEWGTYAEGVHRDTVILPSGWKQRVVTWHRQPSSPRFLEKHDLCASKLARGAQKDLDFVGVLVDAGLVDPAIILARVELLQADAPVVRATVERARAFIGRGRHEQTSVARQVDPLTDA